MIPRYVIYHVASGVIVAVLTGKRSFAEVNLREGEAIVEHLGLVSAAKHRVVDGKVVPR
ncbi:hypothetical protein IGS68_31605 (plasmid) [Skermanella sp. TT6]|uniref:Uncharacterized protein n=1 Tax=Skermanella cutis TaxID=2775420 RepID=A0ABX7BMA9_9PROT|nr:hypothetical protein [Skermanella sp. TT6]QQP93573.1 hypothetical protein IGS68_31605 [Skermanella sp. TT6]